VYVGAKFCENPFIISIPQTSAQARARTHAHTHTRARGVW